MAVLKLFASCLLLSLFLYFLALSMKYANSTFSLHADVKWDLDGMHKQMVDKLVGQSDVSQHLVDALRWTLKDENQLKQEDSLKAVFLLGGPGVGKIKAMQIVSEHAKCQYRSIFSVVPCKIHVCSPPPSSNYIRQTYSDSTKITKYHGILYNTLELNLATFNADQAESFALLEAEITKKQLNKRIFFITGPVMNQKQLDSLKNSRQYQHFLDKNAVHIGKLMKKYAPKVDVNIIKFNSLKPDHVFTCLLRAGGTEITDLVQTYSKWQEENCDFVPEGCSGGIDEP